MIRLFEDNDRLHARLLSGQEITYVTHRALAWYDITFNGEVLFPLGCGTLSQVPISSINISSKLSAPASLQKGAKILDSIVCGKVPQQCDHPLAAACYWMLYCWDLPAGWIAVSQQMLEYRQRILCHLKDLDERNLLLDKLVFIVGPESLQHGELGQDDEKDRLSPPNTTAEPTQLGIPETSKKPHADSINSSSHAEAMLVQMAKSQTFKSRFKNESKGQATEVSAGDLARWAHNFQQPPYRRRIQLHGFWKTKANGHVRID
jgi:hypothetical protein